MASAMRARGASGLPSMVPVKFASSSSGAIAFEWMKSIMAPALPPENQRATRAP
jgi:hypothetical protein